ncbi:MAG: carbohydrate binding domain-containing protein, partial [Pseudomonadota bacterium]
DNGDAIGLDAVVYATDPNITEDLFPPIIDNFGSGAVFDANNMSDPDFNPAFSVTSGQDFSDGDNIVNVGFVAMFGYAQGFAAGFENFKFKVRDVPVGAALEVKFIGGGGETSRLYDVLTYEGSEAIGNGWYQLTIPMADFAGSVANNDGFLIGPFDNQPAPFTFLLTDIGFSGMVADDGGGGGGNDDPDELTENGRFESGDLMGWTIFENNGQIFIEENDASEGMFSGRLIAGPGQNPVLKQDFLGVDVVMPGDTVEISFDMKGTFEGPGPVFVAEFFTEASGGGVFAEILEQVFDAPADWTTYTYTATVAADAGRGITLQVVAICSGDPACRADVLVDNFSVKIAQ